MAHASFTPRFPAPIRVGWRRSSRRPWARPNSLDAATPLLGLLPSLPRAALARLTAQMIADDEGSDDRLGRDHEQEKAHD